MTYRIRMLPHTDPPLYTVDYLGRSLFGRERWFQCWSCGMYGGSKYQNRFLDQVREDIASWKRAEANKGGIVE